MGRLFKRGSTWWCDYYDRNKMRVRKSTKMREKQLAQKVLDSFEIDEKLAERGANVPSKKKVSLESVLIQYESSKRTSSRSVNHVDRTGQLIRSLAQFNGWTLINEINADGINAYADHRRSLGHSSRTISSMVTAVRGFCRWCAQRGKLYNDPTVTVQKPSAKTDRRIERRMVLQEEWTWLKAYLRQSHITANGQPAAERLLMYRLAIETGLRSSELRSLVKSSCHLTTAEPYISVKASVTKNSKAAKQFVSDDLARDLRKHLSAMAAGDKVFNVTARTEMARTLRADLAEARKLWLVTLPEHERDKADGDFLQSPNSQGEVVDFHALRHTCGAWLVLQGITLTEVKEIMRHSTITLTVDCYGHIAPDARSRSRNVLSAML